jgi:hypothetical protein
MLFTHIICCCISAVFAFSPEKVQNHFEWGEYDQLISILEPYLLTGADTLEPALRAKYHCYLGVAYFGTGRIGDARKQFFSALSIDPSVRPDRRYISGEMHSLFLSVLSDYSETKKREHEEDSLRTARQKAFDANLQAIKQEEVRKTRRGSTFLAIAMISAGAAFAGIAAYEYYTTKPNYQDFKNAAAQGDRRTYDRLRPSIQRANGIIFGCALAAGISEASGIIFTIRAIRSR